MVSKESLLQEILVYYDEISDEHKRNCFEQTVSMLLDHNVETIVSLTEAHNLNIKLREQLEAICSGGTESMGETLIIAEIIQCLKKMKKDFRNNGGAERG